MPTEFPTDAQVLAYGHYSSPPSNQQLEGYFHLNDADLESVIVRRGVGFITVGTSHRLRTLLVVHADLSDRVRIIGARLATRTERGMYESNEPRAAILQMRAAEGAGEADEQHGAIT